MKGKYTTTGELLSNYLNQKNITKAEFSWKTNIELEHLNNIIRGDILLDIHTAKKIESGTGISYVYLLQREAKYKTLIKNDA